MPPSPVKSAAANTPSGGLPPGPAPAVRARIAKTDRQARLRSRLYRWGLIGCIGLLLGLTSLTQSHLNVARDKMGLTRLSPLDNAPPVLAFTTVALGGFRGLIANMLWLRATDLQDEDKYFEMVQLADWITKLQPHMVTVWIHLAWNMAYNISVKFTEPSDRWPWVRRGIELLRDEGLKYNPNDILLYRELAWFFQHKMGADLDDAHFYYKREWIKDMDQVLGRGSVDWNELLHPTTPEAQARVTLLREKYKMDPQWMKEVDDRYGPLEWHLPESHAIYWAYLALEKTDKKRLKKDDLITCRRVIFQSLQLAFRRGRLIYPTPNSDQFIYGPNLDIVGRANDAYLEMMNEDAKMKSNIQNAHKNFLKWAVYYLYLYGRTNQAEKWWKEMHALYPQATPEGQTIEEYAQERAQETVGETSHDDAQAMLEGFIRSAYLYLAMNNDAAAENYFLFAKKFRARFQEAIGPKSQQRVSLPTIDKVRSEVLNGLLQSDPTLAALLRTKLNLPAATTEVTNSIPAVATPARGSTSTNAAPARSEDAGK